MLKVIYVVIGVHSIVIVVMYCRVASSAHIRGCQHAQCTSLAVEYDVVKRGKRSLVGRYALQVVLYG